MELYADVVPKTAENFRLVVPRGTANFSRSKYDMKTLSPRSRSPKRKNGPFLKQEIKFYQRLRAVQG